MMLSVHLIFDILDSENRISPSFCHLTPSVFKQHITGHYVFQDRDQQGKERPEMCSLHLENLNLRGGWSFRITQLHSAHAEIKTSLDFSRCGAIQK